MSNHSDSQMCEQCTLTPAELIVSDKLTWGPMLRVCRRCQIVLSRDGETRTVCAIKETEPNNSK